MCEGGAKKDHESRYYLVGRATGAPPKLQPADRRNEQKGMHHRGLSSAEGDNPI